LKVSIITVTYNSYQTLLDTIESVNSQDYKDIEHVIIDGASTDITAVAIRDYLPPHAKFVSEPDEGLYHALNKGINLATGDIIGILHADDIYSHTQVLSSVVDKFSETNADTLYADLHYVSKKYPNRVIRNWKSGTYLRDRFLRGWMPPHPTFFAKRSVFEKFGSYDTNFKRAADYELMLRFLYKHGVSSCYLPDTIVKMRVGGISNGNMPARIKANMEDRLAWKINGLKPLLLTLYLKPLSKLHQFQVTEYLLMKARII
jgi:glycosyltransferase involved in cell wall biosynthesis